MRPSDRDLVFPRALGQRLRAQPCPIPILVLTILTTAGYACGAFAQTKAIPSPEAISLRDAIQRTLAHNPGLRAFAWELPKAAGRLRQAGVRPNPELSFELENFAGSRSGLSGAEATLSVGYSLELGGERSARLGVARADQAVIAQDLESHRLELATETAARYHRLRSLESTLQLAAEEVRGAEEAHATTSLRVRSGAAHAVEERRAEVELANVRLERVQLESLTSLARTRLASLWGEPSAMVTSLPVAPEALVQAPTLDTLLARLDSVPSVSRWQDEQELRRRELALRKAEGMPDLGVMAGVRSLRESDERTFLGGVSLPLPLFDRNAGAVAAARAAVSQAEDEWTSASSGAKSAVIEAHATVLRSHRRVTALREEVLPGAGRAFEEMRTGFERGRFTYLDLLEARRTWTRARREELEALLEYRLAIVELDRLTSATVAEFTAGIGEE
ncbi:MAG: TolC family protein [Candidatus Eisenbacteria bacterium]|nr:TolC family protein [Candidatus Eisenbacteria bacterium]